MLEPAHHMQLSSHIREKEGPHRRVRKSDQEALPF